MASGSLLKILRNWCDHHYIKLYNDGYLRWQRGGFVNAWRMIPKNPKGRVVFVHATGNDALFPQLSFFQVVLKRGYEIFAFDLDGHGAFSSTILHCQHIKTSVEQAWQEAQRTGHYKKQYLVAQSLGGALSLFSANKLSDQLSKMVLVSIPVQEIAVGKSYATELWALTNQSLLRQVRSFGLLNMIPAVGSYKRNLFPIRMDPTSQKETTSFEYVTLVAEIIKSLDLENVAKKVKTPTLLVYGGLDRISPISDGEILQKASSHVKLLKLKRETHYTTFLSKKCETETLKFLEAD